MKKRILSLDDEPAMLKVLADVLRMNGYDITTTTDPEVVLDALQKEKFDLLLLDIKMPGKSGFEVYREIKGIGRELPVLFVTGYPGSFTTDSQEVVALWQEHFAEGKTDILYKPWTIQGLCEKVEFLIGGADDAVGQDT